MNDTLNMLSTLLQDDQTSIADRWIEAQLAAPGFRADRTGRAEVGEYSRRFLTLLGRAVASGGRDIQAPAWASTREFLEQLSAARAHQGFSPSETATFIFSLKEILFDAIRARFGEDRDGAMSALVDVSRLLDALGLFKTEVFQRGREQVIVRQQHELLELSTPVVTLWDGILALPVIGTLDSARTQVVMENLLERIVSSGASIAIIDITGVPTVDTLTAQHLLKTVAAARLMGADCIISGIRPQIAQTIVHLGVELGSVVTKATLADAFAVALRRSGLSVSRLAQPADRRSREAEDPATFAGRNEE
jgi:rsbT co-antagonist protein RsbR